MTGGRSIHTDKCWEVAAAQVASSGSGESGMHEVRSTATDHAQQHCFLLRALFCIGANGSFFDCAAVAAHSHSVLQRDREGPYKRTQCGMMGCCCRRSSHHCTRSHCTLLVKTERSSCPAASVPRLASAERKHGALRHRRHRAVLRAGASLTGKGASQCAAGGFEVVMGVEALAPRQHPGRLSKARQRLHGAQLQLQHALPAASACCTAVLQGVHMPFAALAWQQMACAALVILCCSKPCFTGSTSFRRIL